VEDSLDLLPTPLFQSSGEFREEVRTVGHGLFHALHKVEAIQNKGALWDDCKTLLDPGGSIPTEEDALS